VPVVAGDPEQAEADHQHPGDGATPEGDVERGRQAAAGRLRGAHVGAHGHVHPDVAGGARKDRADREADGGGPGQAGHETDDEEQHDTDQPDGPVLPVEIGFRPLLDRPGDLLHARIAGIERENPPARNDAVNHRGEAASQGKPKARRYGSCHYLPSESVVISREIIVTIARNITRSARPLRDGGPRKLRGFVLAATFRTSARGSGRAYSRAASARAVISSTLPVPEML